MEFYRTQLGFYDEPTGGAIGFSAGDNDDEDDDGAMGYDHNLIEMMIMCPGAASNQFGGH